MTTTQLPGLFKKTAKAAKTFRAINNKTRQSILRFLSEHPGTDVTNLYVGLKLEQSVASQHLAILREASIVKPDRMGKRMLYSINWERVGIVEGVSDKIVGGGK